MLITSFPNVNIKGSSAFKVSKLSVLELNQDFHPLRLRLKSVAVRCPLAISPSSAAILDSKYWSTIAENSLRSFLYLISSRISLHSSCKHLRSSVNEARVCTLRKALRSLRIGNEVYVCCVGLSVEVVRRIGVYILFSFVL